MEMLDRMFEAAKAAREKAYAPYSRFPVGAAIVTETGALFVGCNVENAAYPTGLCAEAAAIGQMAVAGERRITDVMVLGAGEEPITPCGACRQRLLEFSRDDTRVHLVNISGRIDTVLLTDLLPRAFSRRQLDDLARETNQR